MHLADASSAKDANRHLPAGDQFTHFDHDHSVLAVHGVLSIGHVVFGRGAFAVLSHAIAQHVQSVLHAADASQIPSTGVRVSRTR